MKIQQLEFEPAHNPGVLDTATWDKNAAWQIACQEADYLAKLPRALKSGTALPVNEKLTIFPGSVVQRGEAFFVLAVLSDGQQVFIEIGDGGGAAVLGEALGQTVLSDGTKLAAYPTEAAAIDAFGNELSKRGPQALGATPRLGIGTRMTTLVWPGIFDAMDKCGFAANTIQNSVRELNLLEDILAAKPAPQNYACGFGTIDTGYTGSTFEGLWVSGVLAAMQHDQPLRYGADADHLQVKRNDTGLAQVKRVIAAARYYTFYTLDMADVLDYGALLPDGKSGEKYLSEKIANASERREVISYHKEPMQVGARTYQLDENEIGRFVGKYWAALAAQAELAEFLTSLKNGRTFDLEFAIDEHPPEVAAFDCLTSEKELVFVLRELKRRALPGVHVAPNAGMEKGHDYRGADGLGGLEVRLRALFNIAEEFGILLDIHSADDLTSPTRQAMKRATGGRYHYKISPMLQIIFARVLQEYEPTLFRRWWEDARAYATREAAAGSPFAAECLHADEATANEPSAWHQVFHHYSFAYVGRRDAQGRFMYRDEFYTLAQKFNEAYREAIAAHLNELSEDLF
jgi:hypothetical protein